MILEFSIKNFLSFKEKITFSMQAGSKSGLDENYVAINDRKILKTAAVYGANGSGKSNLFSILTNIILMIRTSNTMDINDKLPIIPFKLDPKCLKAPSEFEIRFIASDDIRYVYGFVADANKIYQEYLYYYPNGREALVFDRHEDNYSFSSKDEKILKDIAKKTAPNKFFIATSANWNYEKTKPAYTFFSKSINTISHIQDLQGIAFKKHFENKNNLKEFTLDYLKKADLNIIDYDIVEAKFPSEILKNVRGFIQANIPEEVKGYAVNFFHNGSEIKLDFTEESMGTQILFNFIPFMMETMNNRGILIIDELDRSLHPFLVELIVSSFNDPKINKNNAQLIFNTHDTNLLNLNVLRRDQIWFIEKNNDNGVSDLYSLGDFSIRKEENFEKGYLLGRYGAIPFIK